MWKKFSEEKGESSHHEEVASGSGIGKPIVTKGPIESTILSCLKDVLYQLTNGSGMTFLPSITSSKGPCLGGSRRSTERLIGIPC